MEPGRREVHPMGQGTHCEDDTFSQVNTTIKCFRAYMVTMSNNMKRCPDVSDIID